MAIKVLPILSIDNVEITNVILNRGHCAAPESSTQNDIKVIPVIDADGEVGDLSKVEPALFKPFSDLPADLQAVLRGRGKQKEPTCFYRCNRLNGSLKGLWVNGDLMSPGTTVVTAPLRPQRFADWRKSKPAARPGSLTTGC